MKLEAQLAQLETAQLVHRVDGAELAFIFKHALIQETAYASLLKKTRRDVHLRVAQTIETLYANQLDDFAALLVRHYAEAGNAAKTLSYSIRAGDAAARTHANAEALAHYTRALDLARHDPEAKSQLLGDLFLRRGRVQELSSEFKNALANYEDAEMLARQRGDRALELAAVAARCQIRCTASAEFNAALGEPLAEQALSLARELQDRATESKILWILVNLYRFTERLPEARAVGERSLAIARELNLREQMAYTLNDLSHAYSFGGDYKHARQVIQEATLLWRELGNLPMLADSLSTACMDDTAVGRFDEAIALSDEAYQISQATGNLWGQTYSLGSVGNVYWMRGETAHAMAVMEDALRLSAQSGYPIPQLSTRADLGLALASVGAFERGLDHARRALECANTHYAGLAPIAIGALVQIYLWMGDDAQAKATFELFPLDVREINFISINKPLSDARLASALGDPARALDASARLMGWLNESAMWTFLPEALYLQGLAERGLGQPQLAHASLTQARHHAERLQAREPLWQILGALGEIESADGNRVEADKLFGAAHELITFIADHAPSELRESFLNRSHVRKVEKAYVEK